MCGLVHSTFVTTPVTLTGFVLSVLGGKRVMGDGRSCDEPQKSGKEAGDAYSHGDSFHLNSSQLKPNHTLMTTFPMKSPEA